MTLEVAILTNDKKRGRFGGRWGVDPQGGSSFLLIVLRVLGTLQCSWLKALFCILITCLFFVVAKISLSMINSVKECVW